MPKAKKPRKIRTKMLVPLVRKVNDSPERPVDVFPVDYYSYSSLVKFSTNPILFKIQYMNRDRFDTTSNISGVIGKAFHHAMEVYYGGVETLKPKDSAEALEFGLKAGLDFLEKYNDGFIQYSTTVVNKQKAFDLFTFAYTSYTKYDRKAETVVATEEEIIEKVDIEWRGKRLELPVKLKGYLDKVIREDGKLIIIDYKTCKSFSDPESIDGSKIIQAVQYFLLAYAKYGEAPYSIRYIEVKTSKNKDGSPQVREYEIVFAENELYFDFYFRLYEDVTKALNGQMVYVPNVQTMFDNEVSIVAYIHRLDMSEEVAEQMKKLKVDNISSVLKKQIQNAGNMRKFMKTVEEQFVSAKNLNYADMSNHEKISTKMMEHGMMLQFDSMIEGATVDLYQYTPSIGLKMSRVMNYVADVEQVLGVSNIRILAPIPNTSFVGFEVPRKNRTFPALPGGDGFNLAVGQAITGEVRRFDIRSAPHLLIAGATGSGKSVFLNSIIEQLSTIPNVEMHLFDPKMVELSAYQSRATEYEHDGKKIHEALEYLVLEMNDRYERMSKVGARNISEMKGIPYKFVIIDEFGDLILSELIQNCVLLLAQKARAAGIHLIIATQRPSVDVIKGTIKANFPVKVVFKTAKAIDSRVILDEPGAEKLAGKGDMLFASYDGIERLQGYRV